jgi:hypothetical protein
MRAYEIVPSVGIGPVRLGSSREEVRAAMGTDPYICRRFNADEHHWHQSSFQVHYDERSQTVEFIEVAQSDEFVALYKGVDVHRTKADELVAHVSADAAYDPDNWELGYSYVFRALELSLWRPIVPDSPEESEGRFFEAVGLGIYGYFSGATR